MVVLCSEWTGTRGAGIVGSGLPDEWGEADMRLKEESSFDHSLVDDEKSIAAACWWVAHVLGVKDAQEMTIKEALNYWYEFADDVK